MAQVDHAFDSGAEKRPYEPDPLVTNFVAKRGTSLLGCVQLVRHPEEHFPYVGHWLFSLFVWPLYRGLGVGEELCRQVIAQASAEQAPDIKLLVYDDMRSARSLYDKLGFHVTVIPELEASLTDTGSQRRRLVMRRTLP